MDGYQELRQVLTALRDGQVDPQRLAEVGLQWKSGTGVSFSDYLAERGIQFKQNAAVGSTVALPTAVDETPTFTANGSTPLFPGPIDPARETAEFPISEHSAPRHGRPTGIGRYEVLRSHRAGGLGEVWLARDITVGREVALKTLRPDRVADPDNRTRFVREARVTGRLEHPCIVPLYDLIEDNSGRGPSYVMRFISGQTLAEATAAYHARRAKGLATRLELVALLDAFVAVCRAVAFAHARGVLHRDLKGQNVVLGDFGEVFLVDWGLAKSVGESDTPSLKREPPVPIGLNGPTRSGAVVGTPAYMAPEVAAGNPATTASDIYGLGAVLYALLTGLPPYDGADPWLVVEKVIASDPPLPRAVNPATPSALEAVCRKAMSREPANRYSLAEELATEVRRWQADEPVAAYRDPWTVRATRWARRHRTTVATAAVFLLTTLVALAASTALIWREEQRTAAQKRIAEDNFDLARDVSFNGLNLIESHEANIASVPSLHPSRKDILITASRMFDRALAQQGNDPDLQQRAVRVYQLTATIHRLEHQTTEADQLGQKSVRISEALASRFPDDPTRQLSLANALREYAWVPTVLGHQSEAAEVLNRSIKLVQSLPEPMRDRPQVRLVLALALLTRAGVEYTRGQMAGSEDLARRADQVFGELAQQHLEGNQHYSPLLRAAALSRRAAALRELGRIDEARQLHADAVKLFPKSGDIPLPGVNPADVYEIQSQVRLERARTFARTIDRRVEAGPMFEAAARQWENLARSYPWFPGYRHKAAVAWWELGRLRADDPARGGETRDLFTKSLTLLEPLARDHPDLPSAWGDLGRVYASLARLERNEKRTDEAAEWHRKANAALNRAVKIDAENAEDRQSLEEVRTAQ